MRLQDTHILSRLRYALLLIYRPCLLGGSGDSGLNLA